MKITDVIDESKIGRLPTGVAVGIDIGSRQAKAVLLYNGNVYTALVPTGYVVQETAQTLLDELFVQSGISIEDVEQIVCTGYGRVALSFEDTPNRVVTEIACHGMGAHFMGKDIRTIIDIGGQDSKIIKIDPDNGKVVDFAMNDKCAAGTGRFLERIAAVLGLDTSQIGPISLEAEDSLDISAQCIVFAESEVVSERAKGKSVPDIAAGIHRSVARRVNTLLKRVGPEQGVLFTGGVSNNIGIRKAFEELLGFPIENAKIDTVFAGALGAAVFAGRFAEDNRNAVQNAENNFKLNLTSLQTALEIQREAFVMNRTGKKKRVGFVCAYVPIEILASANVSYFRLAEAGNQDEIMAGETLTQSVFCDITKSILGEFIAGNPAYINLDHVYTFFTCDCMRKSIEAISSNFVPATIYNLPRLTHSAESRDYFITEIENFKKDLEKLTGEEISDTEIVQNIAKFNQAKKLLREISSYRKRKVPLLTSTEFQKISHSYYTLPIDILLNELEKIKEQLANVGHLEGARRPKVMLTGGIVAEGDTKVTGILEDLGANIVVEDNCTGLKPFLHGIPEHGNWSKDLADGYLGQAPCARMKPLSEMIEKSVSLAKEYNVDGVVLYYLKFCPCYSMMLKKFAEEFEKANIPTLIIASDYAKGDEGQIKIRAEAFLEMLEGEDKYAGK